jgi:hypothetical protein
VYGMGVELVMWSMRDSEWCSYATVVWGMPWRNGSAVVQWCSGVVGQWYSSVES